MLVVQEGRQLLAGRAVLHLLGHELPRVLRGRASLPDAMPERSAPWELVKVRLAGRPNAKQVEGLAASAGPPGYRRA